MGTRGLRRADAGEQWSNDQMTHGALIIIGFGLMLYGLVLADKGAWERWPVE